MSKVYTKSGDTGETGLVGGKRVLKSDRRIDLYGEVDELNSRIGFAVSQLNSAKFRTEIDLLHVVQSALFDLGSNLACEPQERSQFKLPLLSLSLITKLEEEIDKMEATLTPLKNFILPGGSQDVASLHLCRTGARSVERKMVTFIQTTKEEAPVHSIKFLNRLSDYFFVLARYVAKLHNQSEILWKPST
jgi:cob(I)alamin adenosyltransferase